MLTVSFLTVNTELFIIGQAINIKEAIKNKNVSIISEVTVTWNNPLYIPKPEPIDSIYKVLKLNTPA